MWKKRYYAFFFFATFFFATFFAFFFAAMLVVKVRADKYDCFDLKASIDASVLDKKFHC